MEPMYWPSRNQRLFSVARIVGPVPTVCLGNPDPVGMKVYDPKGEETFVGTRTTEEAPSGADRRQAA